MEQQKIILGVVISALVVLVGVIVYYIFATPRYVDMLDMIEKLMRETDNVSISYYVEYDDNSGGEKVTGLSYFTQEGDNIEWNNTVTGVEGTFYDLKPYELINYMYLAYDYQIEDYESDIPCYLINALIEWKPSHDLEIENFDYVRILACFDKVTGFPSQYTMAVIGASDARLVSYNSLNIFAKAAQLERSNPPEEVDISQIPPEVWEEARSGFEQFQ